ncbi:hypothetical protein BC832DRAFT_587958 [Gaertneriomyces semiglobifer]|nr:hypothetical protein BC832DRAFT_587958 [Gaertneriomyces semiglobifer]
MTGREDALVDSNSGTSTEPASDSDGDVNAQPSQPFDSQLSSVSQHSPPRVTPGQPLTLSTSRGSRSPPPPVSRLRPGARRDKTSAGLNFRKQQYRENPSARRVGWSGRQKSTTNVPSNVNETWTEVDENWQDSLDGHQQPLIRPDTLDVKTETLDDKVDEKPECAARPRMQLTLVNCHPAGWARLTRHHSSANACTKPPKIFSGIVALLVYTGLSVLQHSILSKRWAEFGGVVAVTYSENVDVLLCSYTGPRLAKELGLEKIPEDLLVLRGDWAGRCIMMQRLLDDVHYSTSQRTMSQLESSQREFSQPSLSQDYASQPTELMSSSSAPSKVVAKEGEVSKLKRKRKLPRTPRLSSSEIHVSGSYDSEGRSSVTDASDEKATLSSGLFGSSLFEEPASDTETETEEEHWIEEPIRAESSPTVAEEDVSTDPASSSEDESRPRKRRHSSTRTPKLNRNRPAKASMAFACVRSGTAQLNLNAHLTEPLSLLLQRYEATNDTWRSYSYRRAITSLKRLRTEITSVEQLDGMKMRCIGSRIREKIAEILQTGELRKLKPENLPEFERVVGIFGKIHGVGAATASTFYAMGCRTLDDLITNEKLFSRLSHDQRIGLKYYDDFQQRIPRAEVDEIITLCTKALKAVRPSLEIMCCGSYRRGKESCGDVDLLVSEPNDAFAGVVKDFVAAGLDAGWLLDSLHGRNGKALSDDTMLWMGVIRCPSASGDVGPRLARRLDIFLTPQQSIGAALLHYTGSDVFNRSLRKLAQTKRMKLSQKGLFRNVHRWRDGEGGRANTDGEWVAGRTEADILETLGVGWKEAWERDCG